MLLHIGADCALLIKDIIAITDERENGAKAGYDLQLHADVRSCVTALQDGAAVRYGSPINAGTLYRRSKRAPQPAKD